MASPKFISGLKRQPRNMPARNNLVVRYLEPAEYAEWNTLGQTSPQGSVFTRSWWLEAVGNTRVLGCFAEGELVAGIPLYFEKRFGISICTMPKLTASWGVVMQPLKGKRVTTGAREHEILSALAHELRQFPLFFQSFHPSLINWLPFYWAGFRQTTRFTYVLDDLADTHRVWGEMSSSARGQIGKAEKAGLTVVPCTASDVYRCEVDSYFRNGRHAPHGESTLLKLHAAAERNNCCACFAVVDSDKKVYSAWMFVWDSERTYALVGGLRDELKSAGSTSLLIWHAIQFAAERTRKFDFAGSMRPGIARFNRNFGARQEPLSFVLRAPALFEAGLQMIGKL